MARKLRKQRVALRFRRREQIKHGVRSAVTKSVLLALIVGFGFGIAWGHNSTLSKFMRLHTPVVRLQYPNALTGIPVLSELPTQRLLFWLPGTGYWCEKKILKKYPSIRRVRLERSWTKNLVIVNLDPRVPLVMWNGHGFDRQGVQFAVMPGAWNVLPEADFKSNMPRQELGQWVAQMSTVYPFWAKVQSLRQDAYGTMELTLNSGTSVIWGTPEKGSVSRKAQSLLRILDDMHAHSGGTARADLRFFDQGRIIVMPKSSK